MKETWKEYCKYCKKFHIVKLRSCPSCGVHQTPQPKSDKIYDKCKALTSSYECDGCEAYRDHLH
jgi:hypothetical protein